MMGGTEVQRLLHSLRWFLDYGTPSGRSRFEDILLNTGRSFRLNKIFEQPLVAWFSLLSLLDDFWMLLVFCDLWRDYCFILLHCG